MGIGKYANLTNTQLQKRKKFSLILLVVLIAAVLLNGSVLIYNLVVGKGFMNTLFLPVAACIVIFIPIYLGKKKIFKVTFRDEGGFFEGVWFQGIKYFKDRFHEGARG